MFKCTNIFHSLFAKFYKEEHGTDQGSSRKPIQVSEIIKQIEEYVAEKGYEVSSFYDDQNLMVVALMTPLMTRVHELVQQAAELDFLDATGTVDRLVILIFQLHVG